MSDFEERAQYYELLCGEHEQTIAALRETNEELRQKVADEEWALDEEVVINRQPEGYVLDTCRPDGERLFYGPTVAAVCRAARASAGAGEESAK